jgi:hypothetical protein
MFVSAFRTRHATCKTVARHIVALSGLSLTSTYVERLTRECHRLMQLVLPIELQTAAATAAANTANNGNATISIIPQSFLHVFINIYLSMDASEQKCRCRLGQCRTNPTRHAGMLPRRGAQIGQDVTFIKNYTVYHMSQHEFQHDVLPLVVDQAECTYKQLIHAAESIVQGVLQIEKSCWECGNVARDGKKTTNRFQVLCCALLFHVSKS